MNTVKVDMCKHKRRHLFLAVPWIVGLMVIAAVLIGGANTAYAGLHDDEDGSHYIEVWVDHQSYTGGCGSSLTAGNSWYLEPCAGRGDPLQPKILDFYMPDLTKVTKVVMYIDLWNVRAPGDVRFAFNDGAEHQANAAANFGRTHHIGEIDKGEFEIGDNTVEFWRIPQGNTYHVHDVSFRLYYDPNDPPVNGLGPLNAQLTGIDSGGGSLDPTQPQTLNIDGDQIELTIGNVSSDVDFVEVYGYFDWYDEDNVGGSLDWHSRGRHNCHQGGVSGRCPGDSESGQDGTIDHIATIPMTGANSYAVTWDVALIPAQSDVKIKLRAVDIDVDVNKDGRVNDSDNAENVRNAPGGVSASLDLRRTQAVLAFAVPDFQGAYIQKDKPTAITDRFIDLPPDTTSFDQAYMVGSYYNNPRISLNDTSSFSAFQTGEDTWALSIRAVTGKVVNGKNKITYQSVRNSPNGELLEPPGPMIVLKRTSAPGADTEAPWPHRNLPAFDATEQPVNSTIEIQVYDSNSGVDINSLRMQVDTGGGFVDVTGQLQIIGSKYNYRLVYDPANSLPNGQQIRVRVDAEDLAGNVMPTRTWPFTTIAAFEPAEVISDDFNVCELNASLWTFVNPAGDVGHDVNGDALEIAVPSGVEHNLWNGPKQAARLIQSIANGNFDIEAKFDGGFSQAMVAGPGVQMHGLIAGDGLTESDGDFVRYDVEYTGSEMRLYYAVFANGNVSTSGTLKSLNGAEPPQYLRVTRSANNWTFYYRYEGGGWISAGDRTAALIVNQVGVFVGNAADNPEHSITLDYFFNRNAPIDPEDGTANILEVQIAGEGGGQVLRDVNCGNPVTLEAQPDLGSAFAGYSGAVNTMDTNVVVNFRRGDSVTATFEPVYYSVTTTAVDKNGAPTANGTITQSPSSVVDGYVYSETVTLQASPLSGWAFAGWTGDLSGDATPVQFNVDADKSIQGVFKQLFTLNTPSDPAAGGTVTADIPGPQYLDETTVQLTATPAPGWVFVGWTGDVVDGASQIAVNMNGDKTVTAQFARVYTMTIAYQGQGSVSRDPEQETYTDGTEVTLTATPAEGWVFVGWEGDLDGSNSSEVVTLDQDKSITAVFKRRYELTIDATNGIVQKDPDKPFYVEGDVVRLTPVANDGYAFARWQGDVSGTTAPIDIVMEGAVVDKFVTALFAEGYGIDLFTVGSGTVERTPAAQPYLFGAAVTLAAVPNPGWEFVGWSGDLRSSDNPAQIVMNSSKTVTATFAAVPYAVTVIVNPASGMGGRVDLGHEGPYIYGEQVQATAIPATGWVFAGWGGDANGVDATIMLRIDGNKSLEATFVLDGPRIFLPWVRQN